LICLKFYNDIWKQKKYKSLKEIFLQLITVEAHGQKMFQIQAHCKTKLKLKVRKI